MTRKRLPSDPGELLRDVAMEPVPDGAFERVALRLDATLAALGPSGTPGSALGAGNDAGRPGWFSGFLATPSASLPVVFALGVAVGATGLGAWHARSGKQPVVAVVPSALVSATPASEPAAPAIDASPEVSVVPLAAVSAAAGNRGSTLALERNLLDRARSRMSSGEPAAALDVLAQHAKRHPHGLLTEEREAMAINVLVSLGRASEARRRGKAFHERFPSSLVRRSVEAALQALPQEE